MRICIKGDRIIDFESISTESLAHKAAGTTSFDLPINDVSIRPLYVYEKADVRIKPLHLIVPCKVTGILISYSAAAERCANAGNAKLPS